MPVYLIIPKSQPEHRTVDIHSVKLTPDSKRKQFNRLVRESSKNSTVKYVKKLLRQKRQREKAMLLSEAEESTAVTNIVLAEMPEDEAADLADVLKGEATVLKDEPITLIDPVEKGRAVSKAQLDIDLWHFDSISLTAAKRERLTGKGVTIAVPDTGVDSRHLEISSQVAQVVTWNRTSNRWVSQNPGKDTGEHGTHVSGLICGKDVGAAPDARIVGVTMIPNGQGMLSDFVRAMEWTASQPEVQIMNMSAGIRGYRVGMEEALNGLLLAGVLPVIAVGNEGRNTSRSPGNYRDALTVGATNRDNEVAYFSGGGTILSEDRHTYTIPDLAAPGDGVLSCVPGGKYRKMRGTSMATPIVSGLAARLIEEDPNVEVLELVDKILETCIDLSFPADRQGRGLAQAT